MSELAPGPLTQSAHPDPHWQLAQRVAESSYFRRGPKLRAFLLYACENAILGRHEELTAQFIGTRVFGRPPDYNLSEDNIVRVEARELRKRLEAYFSNEGRHEPVIIEIPKGSYVPVFRRREPAPEASPASVPLSRRWRLAFAALVTGLIVSAGCAAWLAVERLAGERGAAEYECYSDLLGTLGTIPSRETLLVLSNPPIVTFYGSAVDQPTGESEGRARAPRELLDSFGFALKQFDRTLPHHFLTVSREGYTGIGEAVGAYHLGRLFQRLGRSGRLSQSRLLNWDQVQRRDLIVLGGPSSNDWSYLDDAKSNFAIARGGIRNEQPLDGEQAFYRHQRPAGEGMRVEYGVLKMLTSPYGFKTLLLSGATSAGTAGAVQFFTEPTEMRGIRDRIRAAAPDKPFPSDWEVLLRVSSRDALPVETTAVAVRPAPEATARGRDIASPAGRPGASQPPGIPQ